MKFGINFQLQTPKPLDADQWHEEDELKIYHEALELGLLEQNIATLRATYGARVSALITALRAYLPPDVHFAMPGGGYFVWLTCGEDVDTEALLPYARQVGVSYRPGQAFSAARIFPNALRLSFALYEIDALVQAAERLTRALTLYRTSSPSPSGRGFSEG
jgi:2-aminoadipate transaminase